MTVAGNGGLQRSWSASRWGWDPDLGPWRPENGAPIGTVRLDISTTGIAGREAYDFWSTLVFYNFSARRPTSEQKQAFAATGTAFFAAGVSLGMSNSDSIFGSRHIAQHRADGLDDITVGYVAEGMRWQVDESGEHRAGPGEFFVYDAARAAEVGWARGGGVHLALSRELAMRAGCPPDTTPNMLARMLSQSPLAPFLAAQMAQIWRHGRSMDADHVGLLFPALTALAQAALAPAETPDSQAMGAGRLAAASRFIRDHLGDEDLSPDRIAAAIGCSRATLYRLFAEHDLPIAGYVRELRLQGAMTMLAARPRNSVSAVAARFGFADLSTFSQTFRRRFGVSPRDVGR